MKIFLFIVLIALFSSCSKPNNTNIVEPINHQANYVKGEVAFGLRDSVSLEIFANYIYSFDNISIKEITFFQYYSIFPRDSLHLIKSVLESKNYIKSRTVNVFYKSNESKIVAKFWINNFSKDDIKDWTLLKSQLHFVHLPNKYQDGLLKTPIGKEKEWMNFLLKSNLFSFVELNYIWYAF